VKWAGEKLDELRRRIAGELRAAGRADEAATLGGGMWALRKDQRKLTPGQRGTLAGALTARSASHCYRSCGTPDTPKIDSFIAHAADRTVVES
jgi:Transposase